MNHGYSFDRMRHRRTIAIVALAAVLVTATIVGQAAAPAYAASYPSWGDVQAARSSVSAKQAEIAKIDSALAGIAAEVTRTQQVAEQKGAEYQVALQQHDDAAAKLATLKTQADAAKEKAEQSKQAAGQLAARMARAGGDDLSSTLFFNGNGSKKLLAQLGIASLVKGKSSGIYDRAVQDQNAAQSLSDQADVAEKALKATADAAQTAMEDANNASQAAAAALAEQESNKSRLEAQRAVLAQNASVTEASYNQGEAIRKEAERQAALKAQAEAAAAQAAWNAAHPSQPAGGGGASSSGWVRPSGGRIGDTFGPRINPVTHENRPHEGVDLQPGCGAPIYAAAAGTIIYAGLSGGYGNLITISHGGGLTTRYGHIVNGGFVRTSGSVSAGTLIAYVGSTGNSTGCHLHFETRPGGVAVNPLDFMRARGVSM